MRELCFTIESDQKTITVCYSTREFKFLGGPFLPVGEKFIEALGVFDNFSVADGMDTAAWTERKRIPLLETAEQLLSVLQRERRFFQYDYQYGFSTQGKIRNTGGMSGFKVDGKAGFVDAQRPGQIYLKLVELGPNGKGKVVETRDLRKCPAVETELGLLKVYRRKNNIQWEQKLPQLVEFLNSLQVENIRIRHHQPESERVA